jgi:hypothetical protein
MARVEAGTYLVVHDTKAGRPGPRLGWLRAGPPPRYRPLEVPDWGDPDGPASDLEAVCAIPGRPGELLAAESGHRDGRYGRIFQLRLDLRSGAGVEVRRALRFPVFADNTEAGEGESFEGLACAALDADRVLVILGERGGSAAFPTGVLRWGTLDLARGELDFGEAGRAGVRVAAPASFADGRPVRAIGDLHLDPDGGLWAAATEDPGDAGPFRSAIYRVATVDPRAEPPVRPSPDPRPVWVLDGFKVEALSAPPVTVRGSVLAVGTEDEKLGGAWRALAPAPSGS